MKQFSIIAKLALVKVGDNRLPLRCRSIPNGGRLKSKNDDERNPEDISPRTPNGSMRFER